MTLFTGIRITRSGYKVFRESSEHRRVTARPGLRDTQKPSIKRAKFNSKALRKVFIITVLTIFFCFALFALKIYDLVEVIEFTFILGKDKKVEPWPWFIHETLFRLTEFGLACTVLYRDSRILHSMAAKKSPGNENSGKLRHGPQFAHFKSEGVIYI